jgi:hypothetical protein
MSNVDSLPGVPRLAALHGSEEVLRDKASQIVRADQKLQLHLLLVERAMDVAEVLRRFETNDEDLRVVQMLGMRAFNAFGASLKLALSGYSQNSALVLRDILETVFLLDFFRDDRARIRQWRLADDRGRKAFSPAKVREALDRRDGFTSKKRAELYKLFSELAGHPTIKSPLMMRPTKDGDAVIGPFIEQTTVEAILSEMGRLAIQVGNLLSLFFPHGWSVGLPSRIAFSDAHKVWMKTFYEVG